MNFALICYDAGLWIYKQPQTKFGPLTPKLMFLIKNTKLNFVEVVLSPLVQEYQFMA